MPLDEGVNVDLQFLILEVTKQAKASLSVIERPTTQKLERIRAREDYVDNLKNTLVNKSFYNINQVVHEERQVNYFKALITIATNLERCADYFSNICQQMTYVKDPHCFAEFELRRHYQVVYRALDIIHPALTKHDLTLAQRICDYERDLDDLYDEAFARVRANLKQRRHVDDMLTLLFIARYLERAGDSFLNIGEAILDIHVGEKMGILEFRNLRKGLDTQNIDISSEQVEFKPIMNTRSGSRVAKIVAGGQTPTTVFYKEGTREKIDEEVEGLELWQQKYAGMTPKILWHSSRKDHATLLLEYVEGDDLLEILLRGRSKLDVALDLLMARLVDIWDTTRRNKQAKCDYVVQIIKRKSDILSVHDDLFRVEDGFETMLEQAKKLEQSIRAPFSTLVHGDFNIDNIIFIAEQESIYFVDVHRSGYGDYVQDVSVFLVSNFRIPIFSSDIRQRLNEANRRMFETAREYACAHDDATFEARLALGLCRSLITSTRFLFDAGFSTDLVRRAIAILKELLAHNECPADFRLAAGHFTYE